MQDSHSLVFPIIWLKCCNLLKHFSCVKDGRKQVLQTITPDSLVIWDQTFPPSLIAALCQKSLQLQRLRCKFEQRCSLNLSNRPSPSPALHRCLLQWFLDFSAVNFRFVSNFKTGSTRRERNICDNSNSLRFGSSRCENSVAKTHRGNALTFSPLCGMDRWNVESAKSLTNHYGLFYKWICWQISRTEDKQEI